jgi:putative ABC transport system permease protein
LVVVNETFARHFWLEQNPIGKRIHRLGEQGSYQVIGLLRDEKHDGLDQKAPPSVFFPYAKALATADTPERCPFLREMSIVLRGAIDPKALLDPAREIVSQLDPDVPMYGAQTMAEHLQRSLWARRACSWLFGVFAILAVLLAAAGVYGIVSYAVSQRTQEIGIRMALGARPGQVLAQILAGGMAPVWLGVVAGLAGALVITRLLGTLLFGIGSRDPLVYSAGVLGMICVGLLANLVPARRAAMIDPMRALRFE